MAPRLLSGNQVVYIMMEFGSMLLWDEASKKLTKNAGSGSKYMPSPFSATGLSW